MTKKISAQNLIPPYNKNERSILLDCRTPPGLFEAESGARYIVAQDTDVGIAIVLDHSSLLPFTWIALSDHELDRGIWLGGTSVQLNNRWRGCEEDWKPGLIGLDDGCVTLLCRSVTGKSQWMPLGTIAKTDVCFADYDGWTLRGEG